MACACWVADAVRTGFDRAGVSVDPSDYGWPIPPSDRSTPASLVHHLEQLGLAGGATGKTYEKTRELRRVLQACWNSAQNDAERAALTKWFVKRWGKIGSVGDHRLTEYACTDDDVLAANPARGVSSWSKALAVRDVNRFAIYDPRVAMALNAAQLLAGLGCGGVRFPSMHVSRSPKVRALACEVSA